MSDLWNDFKVNYIHNNPVKKNLVAEDHLWEYSSAKFYRFDVEGTVKVTNAGAIV
ncbi:MAG: hypothetical protein JEY94_09270 [Melioribacteraceae bacterium]|nr:hypothetical protein [Melioribacteraceae bacterium]